ncbi:DUF411 domain-containing protein [Arenimonas donghaensis]|uniref:DUF411 domain-containing protein n=1 Tax=Arenimonas donghaensis DSM 18148 = HO3-R19 TaxID=1121014 RepID=A0A087MLV8_9GAMM|nr:DUF411 domain-containing protein [Arenimonas donghaensis]KFL37861.1 hypothetical protein N788_01450 [Arenimonas donghaensis DSM 18148 = HO3-R19]
MKMISATLALAALLLAAPAAAQPAAGAPANASPVDNSLPLVTVHKSPYCGCCTKWVEHMRSEGFEIKVVETEDLGPVKARVGIPPAKGSCHTAEVDGYFVEGHVPADDVKRLLRERPDARGLSVPGMPAGSPGMEMPDGRVQPYTVELITPDGKAEAFARHGG